MFKFSDKHLNFRFKSHIIIRTLDQHPYNFFSFNMKAKHLLVLVTTLNYNKIFICARVKCCF